MLSLIVILMFGLAIAYFAIQNTLGVTMVLANNVVSNVPLYLIVIGSVLAGVILSWIISGLNAFSVYRKLRGKEKIIEQDQREISSLQEKVHNLEAENTQLRSEMDNRFKDARVEERHDEERERRPSFFYNLFHPRTEHR
jgi:uncharacterized integral membrane protein